jgi:hypothetical protein
LSDFVAARFPTGKNAQLPQEILANQKEKGREGGRERQRERERERERERIYE